MVEIKIEILTNNFVSGELNEFLLKRSNSNIFQLPKFLDYHNSDKFQTFNDFRFFHFVFRTKKIIGFIPGAAFRDKNNKLVFQNPFYSSYGGIVLEKKVTYEVIESIFDSFTQFLRNKGFQNINFDVVPFPYINNGTVSSYVEYELLRRDFILSKSEVIFCLDIDSLPVDFTLSFHNTIRRQLKQAIKNNLEVKIDNIDQEAYDLLVESQKKLGGLPTHTFEELKKINELFPGKVISFKCLLGTKLVAGIIAMVCTSRLLNTFYIFDSDLSRELKGMQLTYFEVIKWAKENDFKYVDFGPGTFGLNPNRGLINYKEKYCANPYLRKNYSVEL